MANPQIEDGYTRVANEILEKVYSSGFNGTELEIILCVWRYTYGFQRKEKDLSESFISKAIGKHKKQVGMELAKLIQFRVIVEIKVASFNTPRVIAFNKNFDEWELNSRQGAKILTPNKDATTTGSRLTTSTGSKFIDQERNNKEIYKENNIVVSKRTEIPYQEIIDYLNEQTGKAFKSNTVKTRKFIQARFSEGYKTDDFKRVIRQKVQDWKGTEQDKYLRPETLFGTKFEGYLNQSPATAQRSITEPQEGSVDYSEADRGWE